MAYLDSTVLNDFQARVATNEKFIANYGMIDLAKDSTPFTAEYIPPSVRERMMTTSASRGLNIPVIKDQNVTVSTVPGFANIPVNIGETDEYYFTAYDVFSGFRFYPASFENNAVDMDYYRDQILSNVLQAMAVAKDDILETVLESRKTQALNFTTQISQGDGTFTFNTGTDTLEINKAAQKEVMFHYLTELMKANKLTGNYRIVTSPAGLAVSQTEAFKYQNDQEKQLLWAQMAMPPDRRYVSDQIATSANFNGFLVRDGDIGLYSNFPWDFRNNTEFAGKKWSVSDVELPFIKSQANIYVNTEAVDGKSLISPATDTNLTMTHFEEMAIWDRFYVVHRYNSDLSTRQNAVVKLLGQTT